MWKSKTKIKWDIALQKYIKFCKFTKSALWEGREGRFKYFLCLKSLWLFVSNARIVYHHCLVFWPLFVLLYVKHTLTHMSFDWFITFWIHVSFPESGRGKQEKYFRTGRITYSYVKLFIIFHLRWIWAVSMILTDYTL